MREAVRGAIEDLQASGAHVLMGTYPIFADHAPAPEETKRIVREKFLVFNDLIRDLAEEMGATLVDGGAVPGTEGRECFWEDGIHASQLSADRMAFMTNQILRAMHQGVPR